MKYTLLLTVGFLIAVMLGWNGQQIWQDRPVTGSDHATMHHGAGGMAHSHTELLSLAEGPDAPRFEIALDKDPVGGWNLHIISENFLFTPAAVNQTNVAGEGHAHIYVNGKKLARVYGDWFHIPSLPTGEVTLQVTLNANDHSPLAVGETALSQVKILSVE